MEQGTQHGQLNAVPMLARMYERRLKGYSAIGYTIEQATVLPALQKSLLG
jgi:hypothetical protein